MVKVDFAQTWLSVSSGGVHDAALSLGNSVYTWGQGKEGQLGVGDAVTHREEPTLVPLYGYSSFPLKVTSVKCGPLQTAAITEEGELYLWGALPGLGITKTPVKQAFPGKARRVRQVCFTPSTVICLLREMDGASNTVWTWGISGKGLLGLGRKVESSNVPTEIEVLRNERITSIAAGETHAAAVTSSGELYLWGANEDNVLGLGSAADTSVPSAHMQTLGKSISYVSIGFRHTLAMSSSGEVYSWGYGRHGVLGIGSEELKTSPVQLSFEGKKVVKLNSGGMHNVALTADGMVYSWGEGRAFKTGHDSEDDILVPTLVTQLVSYKMRELACSSQGNIGLYESYSHVRSNILITEAGLSKFKDVVCHALLSFFVERFTDSL